MAKFYGFAVGTYPEETPMAFEPVIWEVFSPEAAHTGFNQPGGVAYGADGSQALAETTYTATAQPWMRARHALTGAGTFRWVLRDGNNDNILRIGLTTDTGPYEAGRSYYMLALQVAPGGTVYKGDQATGGYASIGSLSGGAILETDVMAFVVAGNGDITITRNGGAAEFSTSLSTLGISQPLYPALWTNNTGDAGVVGARITGTTNDTATPSSAPTMSVSAGFKRTHLAITYPAGCNGVAIYRSTTSGGHDFTQPLVTEWRYPYYEDTGLTNGTTYYYRCKATQTGLAASTASNEVSATPATDALPTISADHQFILGAPAVAPLDMANTRAFWFDYLNEVDVQRWALNAPLHPEVPAVNATGTVTLTSGSKVVNGTNTTFLADYGFLSRADRYLKTAGGNVYQIYWVESDTRLHLWTAATGNESGVTHTGWYGGGFAAGGYYEYINYYDLVLSLYHLFYRTGGPFYLALARQCADSWYEMWDYYIDQSTWESPRRWAFEGLAMRAADGQSGYWDHLATHADYWWTNYLDARIDHATNPQFENVRDPAYLIQLFATIGACHPNGTTQATNIQRAYDGMLLYFKEQADKYTDKVPRINGHESEPFYDFYGEGQDAWLYHWREPFIEAIAMEAAILTHRLAVANNDTTEATAIRSFFLDYMAATDACYDTRAISGGGTVRTNWYTLYQSDEPYADGPGPLPAYNSTMDVHQWGSAAEGEPTAPGPVTIGGDGLSRQGNGITLAQFGYAYYLTGDTDWLTAGDERLDAAWGTASGTFPDGYMCCATARFSGKNSNQHFRRGALYLAYRDVITPLA